MNSENPMRQRNTTTRFFVLTFAILISVLFVNLCKINLIKEKHIENGSISLNDAELDSSVYTLNGTWEFYPGELNLSGFHAPSDVSLSDSESRRQYDTNMIDMQSYGSYHIQIQLPLSGQYAMYTNFNFSTYHLYIKGVQINNASVIGALEEIETTSWNKQVAFFYTDSLTIDVVLFVNDSHQPKNKIVKSIYIGTPSSIDQFQILTIIENTLYLGIFLGIWFYITIFNHSLHRKQASASLGVFCFCTLLLQTMMNGSILMYFIKNLEIGLITRIELIIFMIQGASYIGYLYHMFPDIRRKKTVQELVTADFILILIIALAPSYQWMLSNSVLLFIIGSHILLTTFLIGHSFKQNMKYISITAISMFLLFAGFLMELLKYRWSITNYIIVNNNFFILGSLVFLLCQSYVLASDIEKTFLASKQASHMELAFLQAQISPHFFFNVLNNISYLLDTNLSMAKELLIHFNNYLRIKHKFDFRTTLFYTLEEELELVRSYTNIERIRLHNQIELDLVIDASPLTLKVPPFILQPLVENAIKHGFTSKPLNIKVSIQKEKTYAHVTIEDNGKGMGFDLITQLLKPNQERFGVGIKNINDRLRKCYNQQLDIQSTLGFGTIIQFDIPTEVIYESSHC